MKIFKIQAAILALILFALPMLNIKDANALGVEYNITANSDISIERPKYIGYGDTVTFTAKLKKPTTSKVQWSWDVCGTKQTLPVGTATYSEKTVRMNKANNCKVVVTAALYPVGKVAIPVVGITDNVPVLPVQIVPVTLTGPSSANVKQTFWMEASHSQPLSVKGSKTQWEWKPSGVCNTNGQAQGAFVTGGRSSQIGTKGESKGTCKMTVTLNIYEAGYILRGTAVKNIAIK